MIDTAQAYQNEEGVGRAWKKSGVRREDLFLVSKIWFTNYGYERAKAKMLTANKGKSRLGASVSIKFSQEFANNVSWQKIDERTGAPVEDEDIIDGELSRIAEGLHQTTNALASTIPMWHLECLPDEEAARLCHETITNQGI